ncbi:MAG: hypothetical protein Q3965_00120 [Rothia sp. (in: high G+C Gram-positive bacteria)]|nr:hypothetical protein [Rothia sp. (in: high G+C Gram-positive bacteria)]
MMRRAAEKYGYLYENEGYEDDTVDSSRTYAASLAQPYLTREREVRVLTIFATWVDSTGGYEYTVLYGAENEAQDEILDEKRAVNGREFSKLLRQSIENAEAKLEARGHVSIWGGDMIDLHGLISGGGLGALLDHLEVPIPGQQVRPENGQAGSSFFR